MDIKYISCLKDAVYRESSVPEILRTFIVELRNLSQTEHILDFYIDPIEMKIEEYLKLIDETDENVNPVISEMRVHAQNLKGKFRQHGLNHFDIKMRRKSLNSLFVKMNKTFREGRAVDSINDLLGMEITLHTKSVYDSAETLADLYKMVNLTLEYFSTSNEHRGYKTSITSDCSHIKDTISPEHNPDEIRSLKEVDPHIFVPEKSMIEPRFIKWVKDYAFQPKKKTAYRGVQFVVKSEKGFCLEIQLKTQPARDFLDDSNSPGSHEKHKNNQLEKSVSSDVNYDIIQFDLDFDFDKMRHIDGYRENIKFDRSGIVQAVKWDLTKSTHPNN